MYKRLFWVMTLMVMLAFYVSAQVCTSRGNEILDPGEYCDPGVSSISDSDDIFFGNMIECSDVPPPDSLHAWKGEINCDFDSCQLDTTGCSKVSILPGGDFCPGDCDTCGGEEVDCTPLICQNQCGGGNGVCHYVNGIIGSECESCVDIDSCDDYETIEACEGAFDEKIDACNLALDTGFSCSWDIGDDSCKTNLNCKWNCDGLYGGCTGDGFKYKSDGTISECALIDSINTENCRDNNPANNFPEKIACNIYEENFPVFSLFNLWISLVLLSGYYLKMTFFRK